MNIDAPGSMEERQREGSVHTRGENMEPAFKNIIYEKNEEIATITINRPHVLNELNRETLEEIKNALADAERDRNVRVVIITGSGPQALAFNEEEEYPLLRFYRSQDPQAFCAGADVAELRKLSPDEVSDLVELGREVFNLIENLDRPVIAAVNGDALGAGFELAMACDIIIASDKARFGHTEVNLGVMPSWGGTQKLTRLIGTKKAQEMISLGSIIGANEALDMKIINKVVPEEKLMEEAVTLAKSIASKSPLVLKLAKKAINAALEMPLSKGIVYEQRLYMLLLSSEDAKEGISAFLEKRKPVWKGK